MCWSLPLTADSDLNLLTITPEITGITTLPLIAGKLKKRPAGG
jgi:hypothetical protein